MFGLNKASNPRTYEALLLEFLKLQNNWNKLVERINEKGGEAFLRGPAVHQFEQSEIRTMIKLCHPDKHGGAQDAHEITVKLLSMKQ